jgi:hypothetical protein
LLLFFNKKIDLPPTRPFTGSVFEAFFDGLLVSFELSYQLVCVLLAANGRGFDDHDVLALAGLIHREDLVFGAAKESDFCLSIAGSPTALTAIVLLDFVVTALPSVEISTQRTTKYV